MTKPSERTPLDHQINAIRSIAGGGQSGYPDEAVEIARKAIAYIKARFDAIEGLRR